MPLELELDLPLSNPSTVSEYVQSVRNVLQDIRQLARENLTQARAKQRHSRENRNPVRVWKPFKPGQSKWLRRPKTCKLGKRWTGPFVILNRMGVNYKIQSSSGRTLVAHHDQLKLHYAPTGPRNIFCPTREHGDFTVVDNDPVAQLFTLLDPLSLLLLPRSLWFGLQDCAPMSALRLGTKIIFCNFSLLVFKFIFELYNLAMHFCYVSGVEILNGGVGGGGAM